LRRDDLKSCLDGKPWKEIFCTREAVLMTEIEIGTEDYGDEAIGNENGTHNATGPHFPAHGAEGDLGRYHTAQIKR